MPRWILLKVVPQLDDDGKPLKDNRGQPVFLNYKKELLTICKMSTQRQDQPLNMDVFDKHLDLLHAIKATPDIGWWKIEEQNYTLLLEKVKAVSWTLVDDAVGAFLKEIRDATEKEPPELVTPTEKPEESATAVAAGE